MKKFLTQKAGFAGPTIEACDFAHAELLATDLGIVVLGEHILTISKKGFTEADADKVCKALSESIET